MNLVWRAAIASALTVILSSTVASEATSAELVITHSEISVKDRAITRGDGVLIVGRIRSRGKMACRINRSLTLWFNGERVGAKRTDDTGKALFWKMPKRSGDWQVRFVGFRGGIFPVHFYCLPSKSDRVRVRVT